jgi:hypothetical protein
MWGSTNRITVQASLSIKQDPISKVTSAKRIGWVVQAVENLSNKHEGPEFKLQYCQKKKCFQCTRRPVWLEHERGVVGEAGRDQHVLMM